jgi:thioredoxin 1
VIKYPDKPIDLTDANFDDNVKKYPLIVVDNWAPWCPPCRMLGPVIDSLAKKLTGKVMFGKLNVDENKEVSCKYEVMSVPTLLIFKNGKLIDRLIGAMPESMLELKLKKYF